MTLLVRWSDGIVVSPYMPESSFLFSYNDVIGVATVTGQSGFLLDTVFSSNTLVWRPTSHEPLKLVSSRMPLFLLLEAPLAEFWDGVLPASRN
jgi:hypothetical protein